LCLSRRAIGRVVTFAPNTATAATFSESWGKKRQATEQHSDNNHAVKKDFS
jgi:hypothetical protein